MNKHSYKIVLCLSVLLLAGCREFWHPEGPAKPAQTPASFVPVTGISGVTTTATVGTGLNLSGTVAPDDATNKTIVWNVQSAGTTGASINSNTLNTTAAGTVIVRATITNGLTASTNYTQDFPIVVSLAFVPVTGILGVPTTATAGTGLSLSGTVEPSNATNKTIVWNVQNAGTTGASISGNTLNTTAAGTVTVRATIANGLTASANYIQDFPIVVSLAFVPVTGISGVPTTATVGTGLSLSCTVEPSNATNKTIVWNVQNAGTTGATMSGNTLNTTAAGTVTVRATIANGSSASANYTQDFLITVSLAFVPVTGISGVPTTATVGTGLNLSGTVAPSNATNKTIVWNVQNAGTTGAVISGNTLNATGAGTVTVRATITNGSSATANYTQDFPIVVSLAFVPVTGISSVPTTATAGTGLNLSGTVAPANATNKTIIWNVQNAGTTGASISGNTLNTTAAGTVTVRATIVNGLTTSTNYTQDFTITVRLLLTLEQQKEMVPIITTPTTITGSGSSGVFIAGRTVTLSPFKMAKYETTYQLWKEVYDWATNAVRGSNIYTIASSGVEGHGTSGTGTVGTAAERLTRPVTTITWRDAIVWCNAYSEMNGKEPVYYTDGTYGTVLRVSTTTSGTATDADKAVMKSGANGYRLPTEAEWEFAARGGNQGDITAWGYTYAGSGTLDNVAWYSVNSFSLGTSNAAYGTHLVGTKAGNDSGLYDMSGNVREWCWDWNGTTNTGTATDPGGAASGTDRVVRGGSWYNVASGCTVTYRTGYIPYGTSYYIGFRAVCP